MLTTRRPIDMLLGVNLMKKGEKRAKNAFGAKSSVAILQYMYYYFRNWSNSD